MLISGVVGQRLIIVNASTPTEIDTAFPTLARERAGHYPESPGSRPSCDVEIEAAIVALGREPGGGLVVTADAFMFAHRAPIILAAARNNVPAVSWLYT